MTNWIISMDLEAARYCFSDLVIELRPQLNTLILETPDHSTVILSINEWPALRDFIDRALTLHAAPQSALSSGLKPFNREAALAGAPVRTRDGHRKVFNIHQRFPYPSEGSYPLLACLEGIAGLCTFTSDGKCAPGTESPCDLFME